MYEGSPRMLFALPDPFNGVTQHASFCHFVYN